MDTNVQFLNNQFTPSAMQAVVHETHSKSLE